MPLHPHRLTRVSGQPVSFRLAGNGPRRILFFHGFPGSSAQLGLFDTRLAPDGLTVLCLDRPGYGKSAASPLSQIAQGILHCRGLLEELGWEKFEVFAVSGGAPLGLSLSHELGRARVSRTTVACGLGPLGDPRAGSLIPRRSRAALAILPRLPTAFLARALKGATDGGAKSFNRNLSLLKLFFDASSADQEVLGNEGVQAALVQAKVEAFEQGGVGPQGDARSYLAPWSWEYSRFSGPVRFFHGEEDKVIPPAMARFMAKVIPSSELHLIEGEGHFSLPIRQLARILA